MGVIIHQCGILVLAGGQSKRLGTPKQLLLYKGKTLLHTLLSTIQTITSERVFLVLGAYAAEISAQISDNQIQTIYNENWEEGMASSIRTGVAYIQQHFPSIDGIMIVVCDQPFLTTSQLLSLIEIQRNSGLPIAASAYKGVAGTPVLFHQSFFDTLLQLKGDKGARTIIQAHISAVATVPFEKGEIDIDTQEAYQQLLEGEKEHDHR